MQNGKRNGLSFYVDVRAKIANKAKRMYAFMY